MVDADHLHIVFQVSGVGFAMPVGDLLAIRGTSEESVVPCLPAPGSFQRGSLIYLETEVMVNDLPALFGLAEGSPGNAGSFLIFAGSDCPWAVRVDSIAGVFDAALFEFQELPIYLFPEGLLPYRRLALYNGQALVSVDARQIDLAWRWSE